MEIEALLIGNPNTGKTSVFNSLTKSDEHVGNWHGVTVDKKQKVYDFKNDKISIVDLPGLYSLTTLSYEEEVARNYFFDNTSKKIVNLCDASNLRRNLYLTLNLIEFQSDLVVAINQIDKNPKYRIDSKKLSSMLKVPVVMINANKKEGFEELNNQVLDKQQSILPSYLKEFDLSKIKQLIGSYFPRDKLDFYAVKCLECDEKVFAKLPEKILKEVKKILPENSIEMVAKTRYHFIDEVLNKCTIKQERIYGKSKLDKIIMNKFFALPIFVFIFAVIFYLTFFSVGKWISDIFVSFVDVCIKTPVSNFLISNFGENSWVCSLFSNAILGGVGTVLSFLPQVAFLFLFLSILEDSGYLSRVAFCFEDILGKVGLSGKSVYTLLMGFGCSSTAVLTARNMEDKNAKIKTAILTPYMSCSAKFPIYLVIGGAFFGKNNIFVIMGLYFLGVLISILLSLFFEKTFLKSKEQSFILEFPPYRLPSMKRVGKILLTNIRDFVMRIGTLLIAMNVIVWLLSNFSFDFRYVGAEGSMLEGIGKVLSPIFIPLGFGSWGATSALIAGIVAKEVIVSSIIMFNKAEFGNIKQSLQNKNNPMFLVNKASALSFLVYSLLYIPCLSTMIILRKEIGFKWTIIAILLQLMIAYFTAFVVFNIFQLIEFYGVLNVFVVGFVAVLIICSFIFVFLKIKNKKTCPQNCHGCDKCDK